MIRRRDLIRAGSITAGALAVGVSGRSNRATAQNDHTFVIGSLEEPGSLSALVQLPHHFPADVPQTLLFDSLTQFMPDSTVEPKLATGWEVSDDELTYTFSLNPDATFHDGTRITAEDVVFTFNAAKDPATNSSDEGLEAVAHVTAIDDHTVEVELSQITPAFLAMGGARGIVPRHLLEGKDIANDIFNREPVGSGPYRFVSYTPGEAIILEAVEDHYRVTPGIRRVEFRIITDQNVLLTQLMSGELNYGLVTPHNLEVLEGAGEVEIIEVKTPRYFNMIPNFDRQYWQEKEVRAAILGAIDRQGFVDSVLLGRASVINANVAPASWAYAEDGVTGHPYDPEASAAALDEAGWLPGDGDVRAKDGVELAFTVALYSYDQTLQQLMLLAQQNLGEIGVRLDIEMVEPGVFNERRDSGEYDALGRIWNPVYDPDQGFLFKSGNFYGYSNPQVDELFDEAVATTDQGARMPVYEEIQHVLSEELPNLFLYSENELHAIATTVAGLEAHPVNVFWDFPAWTVN